MGERGMSPAAETLSTRNQKLAQKTFVYGKDGNRLKKKRAANRNLSC